ncbi:hypothetical protein N7466_005398 [Penicillium verhagenii]|uniref:uncharacterized protein n=1 Tax=Penicillium verhagenii TaxID=1562060 RepID=UPI0025458E8D|nr:uncharacterized protein N7466_005398 [Penicillium verhagenii]KAJ5935851.1 hypothetical protein N7466_005398 [Penicillium verhagenii]
MTSDKQNNGFSAKPFTPTLSAAFHRSNKSPLTPKLASSSPGHPAPRRLAHTDHTHPFSTPSKEDLSATPPNFLGVNVTPRSGSRNTRRDAVFPSPTNTSSVSSPQTTYTQPTVGLGLNGVRRERSPARGVKAEQSNSLRAKTLKAEGQQISRPNSFTEMAAGSPMFFHAAETRSSNSSDVEQPRPKPGKMPSTSSFMYANGDQERQSSPEGSYVTTASSRRSGGLPRVAPTIRQGPLPPPRLKSPRVSDASSPLIDIQSNCSSGLDQTVEGVQPHFSSPPSIESDRPQLSLIGKHRKSSSMDSTGQTQSMSQRNGLHASPVIMPNVQTQHAESFAPVLSDQIPTLRPRVFSNGSSISADPYQLIPMSPGKSDSGEVALNARTERKIMDLEISNSSLLAINRTLEREMRKQNAELRRFRRLSRSGRLSMVPSTRSFSGTALSTTSELDEGNSELSSIRSNDEMSDFSDEDSVADDGVLSPDTLADHDAKHSVQDEKRFMLDLARHQEFLVDSQKLNQSLKRCLGWTEELIKEGQRALEYNVHVQDVEIGGRVLSPEELGEVGESGRSLLSPSAQYGSFMSSPEYPLDDSLLTDPALLPLPSSPGGTD